MFTFIVPCSPFGGSDSQIFTVSVHYMHFVSRSLIFANTVRLHLSRPFDVLQIRATTGDTLTQIDRRGRVVWAHFRNVLHAKTLVPFTAINHHNIITPHHFDSMQRSVARHIGYFGKRNIHFGAWDGASGRYIELKCVLDSVGSDFQFGKRKMSASAGDRERGRGRKTGIVIHSKIHMDTNRRIYYFRLIVFNRTEIFESRRWP